MRIAQRYILAVALIAAMFGAACSSESPAPATPSASAQSNGTALDVDVVKVTTQKLDTTQNLPGELTPYEIVAIYPKVTGFVKSISVDRGSHITKGQLIVQLEAPELAAQRGEAESKLQTAESQLAGAQAKLASDQGTYDRLAAAAKTPGVVAGNDLQIAEKAAEADRANVRSYEGIVASARASLNSVAQMESYLRVTAPFDGVVTERNVHPGALVGPSSGSAAPVPMLRIETTARLRLVVPVPETLSAEIPSGTMIKFTVQSYPTETFQAPVARISHAIDAKTRTMPVELEFANSNGRLTAGTFCQVQWPVRRATPSHFVPPTAIATNQERTFLIRVPASGASAGKAEWVDVKSGATVTTSYGTLIEVFGNLSDGDQVVLRATDAIRPSQPLNVHSTESH